MTSGRPTGEWLLAFLRENALTIVLGVAMAYGWFTSNNAALVNRIAILEAQVAEQRATAKARSRFDNAATNQLNFLCATASTCRQLYAPIVAPE
ncbi:hypothetical protein [Sphingopyxis sp. JAI128]|uniref:hypothetical protein n=1 Tax=Sphingopyxis sp. JAI128 TaxID=2723066 RepID=UPI00160FAAE4|nr:hypothetical protein [Sphingopyxis sp. JAI128]MBB6424930.1 hypothetical protein [Sphingopyxis sp. JAI128]